MLIKYITTEYYSNDEDFNLYKTLESLNKEYPTDDFKIESVTESQDGDEIIIKISQTVPFGVEPIHMEFEFDNNEY
jgi:hypothetical protein